MTSDVLSDLEHLGELLSRLSDPITIDQLRGHDTIAIDDLPATLDADALVEPADNEINVVAMPRPVANHHHRLRVLVASLVAAAAVLGTLWLATSRPGAKTGTTGPISTTAQDPGVAFDNDGTVPCADFGCGEFDPVAVAPGADDFYIGPASLGDPHISQSMWNGLIRCAELDAAGICTRIEGLGIVALVNYGTGQADQVQVGTTFGLNVTLEEYAAMLGPIEPAPPAPVATTIRGHSAMLFDDNGQYPAMLWEERPGVLVWVAVPPSRQAELTSIANAVVLQPGPSTIPGRLVVPNTGEPWLSRSNNGTGLVIARFSGKECIGWGYIDQCSSRIEDRTFAAHFQSAAYIAGSVPPDVAQVRVTGESQDPIEVTPFAYAGFSSRFYQVTLPPDSVATVEWLGADGSVIATDAPAGRGIYGSE